MQSWIMLIFTFVLQSLFLTVDTPKVVQHPENQSVIPGKNVNFSIEATGDNLQFKWQKDGIDLSDGDKYFGVNTDTLYIVPAEAADEGDYRCLVENDVEKLFSDEAVLSFGKLLATATCTCSGKLYNLQFFVGSYVLSNVWECRHFNTVVSYHLGHKMPIDWLMGCTHIV